MRQNEPPRMATWMLLRLTPSSRNEALIGDLFEGFRDGRSAGWYWRQSLVAVAIAWLRDLRAHVALITFVLAWSVVQPGWVLIVARSESHNNLIGSVWRIDWPWSTILYLCLSLALNMVFIWAGALLFLLPNFIVRRQVEMRQLRNSLIPGLLVYLAAWTCIFVLHILPPMHAMHTHSIDMRTITVLGMIAHWGPGAIRTRIPTLLALAGTLWQSDAVSAPGRSVLRA
jgi:hypothetical protein